MGVEYFAPEISKQDRGVGMWPFAGLHKPGNLSKCPPHRMLRNMEVSHQVSVGVRVMACISSGCGQITDSAKVPTIIKVMLCTTVYPLEHTEEVRQWIEKCIWAVSRRIMNGKREGFLPLSGNRLQSFFFCSLL